MCLTFVPVSVFAEDLQQDNSISVLSITPDEGTYRTYVFKANGETISTQIVKNGDTLLEPQVPAQDGKVFTGWDKTVPFGVIAGLAGDNQTITVNAQFKDGYHVYFKDNNGRIIATKTVTNGTKVTFEDVNFPVGNDEAITGWYKDTARTEKVESVTINGADITLYAKVEPGYWLTFESNGGSYVAPAFYAKGTAATAPTALTKPGYTFDGWYTDKDLKTPADFSSITVTTTLYAKWTENGNTRYTVIHWLENADDDGYSADTAVDTKYGKTGADTAASARSYTGFTAQAITQKTIAGDGSTIVSVKYKRNVYKVTFYLDDPIYNCGKEAHTHSRWKGCYNLKGELTCKKEAHTHSSACGKIETIVIEAKHGANISDQWPTVNGSSTWRTSKNGNTYQANIDTMPLGGTNFYGPKTGNRYETAYYYVEVLPGEAGTVYNGVTYKEHHHDTTPATGLTVSQEDKYDITGFAYKEGTQNGGKYNNAKFYYTRNEYKIVFVNNGSTDKTVAKKFEQSIADASYTPTAPAGMTDYVFAGWYDNELGEGTAYVFDGKTMPANNITLYAVWMAPTYTVTVYDVDGSVHYTFNKVAKNSTISSDVIPDLKLAEGETFLGWVQKDGTPFSFSTKINRNYDLYAKVGNNSRYTVTYHSNTTPDATVTDDTMIYAKDVLATVNDNSFTNGDKVFLSWNTKDDGTGTTYYPNGTIKVTGNMDLYARWGDKASTVSVTYHSNFAPDQTKTVNGIANNGQITVAAYDNTLGLPARTGYTFAGWNTKADCTGTRFAAGADARVNDTEPNDLYAQWEANTDTAYKVEFYYQNGDSYQLNHSDERTGTTDTTVSVTNADKEAKENGKYVYDTTAANVESGPVAADGSLVLKLYFKLNQADVTVNYYWNETTDKVATSKKLSAQTVGSVITTETPITIEGYTALPNQTSNLTVGADASKNVINFYYYKNVELTANSKTETYDGTEKSVSGYTGAPAAADFSAITVGAKGTNVGTYPASFAEGTVGTVDANKKYIVTKANNGALVINPVTDKVTVTINGHKDTKTYDGKEHSVTGYDVTITGGNNQYTANDFSFTGTAEAKGTNVKTDGYSMGLTAAQFTNTSENFSNVKFEVTDGKLTINPRKVTLTSESGEKEYDGTPLTKPNVTVGGDGFVTGEVTDIKATGSVTYVSDGEVTNTITYTTGEKFNADNYNISKSEGKLKITDRTAKYEITVKANRGEKTYDGTPLDVSGFENLEFTVNGQKYTVSGLTASKTGTNVSDSGAVVVEGTAVVKDANGIDVTKQFKVNTEDGQLTINPRTVTLTSGDGKKEYNGTPLTNKTVSVTGDGFVTGEGATYDVTGAITNVAENKPNNNTFTYTLSEGTTAGNYVIEIMYGTLEITPVAAEVTVEIKGHTTDAIYDATEKTAEGYEVISISNELYTAKDFALTGKDKVAGTAAGKYDMGLAFKNISKNFSKVTFVVKDGKLTIAKRDVTVTGESATKVYNGQTQEINGYTVDNLVEGHEMTGVTYSAKGKDPGKYDGSFTGSQIVIKDAADTDVTANYNVKPVIGVLTITQPSHPTRPSTPTKDVTSVKTADGSQMTLWMSMMLASAAGIVFLGKKRKEEQ